MSRVPPRPSRRAPSLTRRAVLAGALGAGTAGALAACSGGGGGTTPQNTLNVWGGVPPESGPGALVDAFHEAHPEYTVNYTRFVNDDRGNLKLDTALQGGVDIDVYFTYATGNLALRAGSGMTLDLTDRVEADPELAEFLDTEAPKGFWQDDRLTALATTREPNMILVNLARLEAAGIELPQAWTLDEFVAAAAELTGDGTYGAYMLPDTARVSLGPNYWYTDDGGSNFADPAFGEHMALSRDLIDDGVLYPWTEILARQLEAYQQNAFVAEDFALWMTAPFSLRFLADAENYPHDFKVAAAPIPTTDVGAWNTGVFGNHIMVNPRSSKQDLAWEFVRFWILSGSEFMAPGGKIPTLQNVGTEDMLGSLLGPDAADWFDVDSFRRVLFDDDPELFVDTNLTAFPEIDLAVRQQRDLCWIGERAPVDAVDAIDRQAGAAITRYGRSS
ncbi:extracellular solute-binding protein family 1 [Beutenbergia cavernae DSM 12333]|uniref:Extracellular solute-binding protein family 1 n=1 Tax=Beutenbergia cavernae (strain ATCC BAA-8 / DSM 12333 / CCUG 43141 / JCM 11478 / NBRC 16432 / NCIMB 13614 / HKI 0122) TaxID=471853 RepID=C5BWC8_BEUC1|nr:extracellular solute-binding protein [Beutenbergia cavernae]ACQ78586.1 extracellular solute-binding protein family 1 [Beutenbergia cavernae DSM 12333]